MASFGAYAKKNGIKYFLISFVDLFGTMRAKLVPATAIDTMAKAGAGFAGFAVWFDMTPAHAGHPGDGRSRDSAFSCRGSPRSPGSPAI